METSSVIQRHPDLEIIKSLADKLTGTVILPDDGCYDEARKAWNLYYQHHPAIIVMAHSASDIAAAAAFAREADLDIAVQATGHGVRRPANDCLLINTSQMNNVRIDANTRTAWVEAGAKWEMVLEKAQSFGLAPLLGSSPNVGAVGYTLGGGMGWLARRYGLSCDSVIRFEVVTADGQVLSVSATDNPELFWGLRGGGGSLAIVAGMEIQLYPVTTVYGGNLIYRVELAREVLQRYRNWIETVPLELTSSVILINYPPIAEVPEFLRGQSFVQVRGCFSGPVEEGEAYMWFWRNWQAPLVDDFKVMPFGQVAEISADPIDPMPALSTGAFLSALDDEAIDTVIHYSVPASSTVPVIFTEIRHAGGLIADVDSDSSAYGNRQAPFSLQIVAVTPDSETYRIMTEHINRMKQGLRHALTGGVYLNFLEGQESLDRTPDAYTPKNYRRLSAIKAVYDPKNRLCYSFAIPPEAEKAVQVSQNILAIGRSDTALSNELIPPTL